MAEARRRLALKPGDEDRLPARTSWAAGPELQGTGAKYLQHVYGENELGGTQVLKLSAVPFEKLGHRPLPERSYASISESLQHTLYRPSILPVAVLGVLGVVAKRNAETRR